MTRFWKRAGVKEEKGKKKQVGSLDRKLIIDM